MRKMEKKRRKMIPIEEWDKTKMWVKCFFPWTIRTEATPIKEAAKKPTYIPSYVLICEAISVKSATN